MKKVLCFLLAVMMIVGLCGCFGGNDADDAGGGNPTQPPKEPEFSLGKTDNNTYTNDFLGIGCTLPARLSPMKMTIRLFSLLWNCCNNFNPNNT